MEYPLLPTGFFNLHHCSISISANSVSHAPANKMHKGEMMQAQQGMGVGGQDTLTSFRSFEFEMEASDLSEMNVSLV